MKKLWGGEIGREKRERKRSTEFYVTVHPF
jgi:hypothetical protein